jgi:uncharacterized membrane protein YedE/YeeE
MKRLAVAYACGVLFAVGLGISGMTHPSKVLGFLDFAGAWDPSLLFVMGAGVLVNFVAFRLAKRRISPWFARSFALPAVGAPVDASLVAGAAIFGVGWGLGGFCPGPAVVSVVTGAAPVVAFVVAMVGAMLVFDAIVRSQRDSENGPPAGRHGWLRRTRHGSGG